MDAGIKTKLAELGYDEKDARIIWFNGHPDGAKYFGRQEKRICLTTVRGNLPGIYFRIKAGKTGRNSKSGLVKNILLVMLKEFGFDFFVCVSTDEIFVNGAEMCYEQCKAFRLFWKIFAAHNHIQRDAGFTWQKLTEEEGPFCAQSMTQWPVTAQDYEQDKQPITREMVKWINNLVHDKVERLNAENSSEERQNPNYQGQLFSEAKQEDRNNRIRNASHLSAKLSVIHETRSELVSLDRPTATPFIDGIICGYAKCFSISCGNNVAKIEILREIFNRYKQSVTCIQHNQTTWSDGIWLERNTQSEYFNYDFQKFSKIFVLNKYCFPNILQFNFKAD